MTEEIKTMRLTYVGRRILNSGKLSHCFLADNDADGNFTFFPKAKSTTFLGLIIGNTYEVPEKGALPRIWTQVKVDSLHPVKRDEWQVKDRTDYQISQQKNISASPDLDKMIASLRSARQSLGTSQKRSAFDAWLLDRIR